MPIVEADIVFRFSGGAANSTPGLSLGGVKSSEVIPETLHGLFDLVTGTEGAAGDIEYRGVYVHNAHGTLALLAPVLWIFDQPDGDSTFAIALADEAVNATMETIADESTAPSGPSFTAPASKAAGLVIPDIPAGQHKGFWIRRTVSAGADAIDSDSTTIRIEGDTAA